MEITIFGKEVKTKTGKTFVKYSYTKDGATFYNVKVAQKSTKQLGNRTGYLKISFELDKSFVKKGKVVGNDFKENDTIWILELIDVVEDTQASIEAEARRKKSMEQVFAL